MSKRCDSCFRGPQASQTRSHSNIATKHRLLVNLQPRRVEGVKVKLCTKCLKTAKGKA